MAEFDEDINLDYSDALLDGDVSEANLMSPWTKGLIGVAAGLPALGYLGREAFNRVVINDWGRNTNNFATLKHKNINFYNASVQASTANKYSHMVEHVRTSPGNDAFELISKAKDNTHRDFIGSNPHADMLGRINSSLPKGERIGTVERLANGGWQYDYSNVDPKDEKIHKILQKKSSFANIHGRDSIGAVLDDANLQYEELRDVEPGEYRKLRQKSMQSRHSTIKDLLAKHVSGKELTPKELSYFDDPKLGRRTGSPKNNKGLGISAPKQTQVDRLFKGMNKSIATSWQLHPKDTISISRVTDPSDMRQLTKSVENSHVFNMQKFITAHANGDYTKGNLRKLLDEYIGWFKPAYGFGVNNKPHYQDDINQAAKHVIKNGKVKTMSAFGKAGQHIKESRFYVSFSPHHKPHYLLGGVSANVGTYKLSNGAVMYDLFISDEYDVVGSELQKKRHINYHHDTNDKRIRNKVPANQLNVREYNPPSLRIKNAVKNKEYKKAAKEVKAGVNKKTARFGRNVSRVGNWGHTNAKLASEEITKRASKYLKKAPEYLKKSPKGKMGLVLGSAALAAIAIDRFLKPDDDS